MTWSVVLFDFDGVLCDSRALAVEYVEELREDPRFAALPSASASGHFGDLYRGELRHALRRFGVSDPDAQDFFRAHAGLMRDRTADLTLFDGVREGLASLPAQSFAIITSAYGSAVQEVLLRGGVPLDDIEVIGHEVRESKTEKARKLLTSRSMSADGAVYVGDMESDIDYCNALGMRCIGVTYGYHPASIIHAAQPFDIADSPDELFSKLLKGFAHEGSAAD